MKFIKTYQAQMNKEAWARGESINPLFRNRNWNRNVQ
jgi:hypothetical protein